MPFMEPGGSLLCSQEPTAGPHPELDQFLSHIHGCDKIHNDIQLFNCFI